MTDTELNALSAPVLQAVGNVLTEKLQSLRSKRRDDIATGGDLINLAFAEEVMALALNRISSLDNAAAQENGEVRWAERTESHNPHIRLHGGALEDNIPPMESLKPQE